MNIKKRWLIVIVHNCNLGKRGEIVSAHGNYDRAVKAARKSGYDSFLKIVYSDEY